MGFVNGMSLRFPTLDTFSACGALYRLACTLSPVSTTPRDCFTGDWPLLDSAKLPRNKLFSGVKPLIPTSLAGAVDTVDLSAAQPTREAGIILGYVKSSNGIHIIILAYFLFRCK